ncbi:unnamed protein product [Parajaminaea phylloscopi]
MSSTAAPAPDGARAAFNIKVLRRHDPAISSVVYSTSFVVLYEYVQGAWTKSGIEGPMFLFRRDDKSPHYGIYVLNRNGVENYAAHITRDDDLDVTEDFVIFRPSGTSSSHSGGDSADGEEEDDAIVGIWVFEKDQRRLVGEQMARLQELADKEDSAESNHIEVAPQEQSSNVSLPTPPQQQRPAQSISLDALFSPGPPTSPPVRSQASQQQTPSLLDAIFQSATPNTTGPASQQSSSSPVTRDDESALTRSVDEGAAGLMAMLGLAKPKAAADASRASASQHVSVPESSSSRQSQGVTGAAPSQQAQVPGAKASRGKSDRGEQKQTPQSASDSQQASSGGLLPSSSDTNASEGTHAGSAAFDLLVPQLAREESITEPGLSKNDFVRRVLGLIHTRPDFVQALYQDYCRRTES